MSAFERIAGMLEAVGTEDGRFPPTDLYSEGWMLRLCLDWFSRHRESQSALQFNDKSDWYSEALLPSAFLARERGDSLAESWTHADGVIGDIEVGKNSAGGLSLRAAASQLVITEAKMFSKLSSGVKNARYYDQAARNVACIAEVLNRADLHPASLSRLGFFVVAPQSRIDDGVFEKYIRIESIRTIVEKRVAEYNDEPRRLWFEERFLPVLDQCEIRCVSWEELIADILQTSKSDAHHVNEFYEKCLGYNQPLGRRY